MTGRLTIRPFTLPPELDETRFDLWTQHLPVASQQAPFAATVIALVQGQPKGPSMEENERPLRYLDL
jgi:hypothetical protein